jgi:UDP-N-acetylmuramoyl-L-alanyl-D-glutamate--2,6-diaminopimelate ligase
MVAKNPEGVSVVNLNMEFAKNFLRYSANEKYGYSIENPKSPPKADQPMAEKLKTIIAENIELRIQNTKYKIQDTSFRINLPGEFNIENALAATCVGLSQNILLKKISEALAEIKGIPGRMERIENDRGLEIIVDYAVTPDSLEKLYNYITKIKKETSKVIAVFGSCGERDRGKRPIMGKIVSKTADFVIVTNEDPYYEDPMQIINEVFEGVVGHKVEEQIPNFQFSIFNFQTNSNSQISKIKKEGTSAFRILDRREAIKTALRMAGPGDIVVVTGKGAEETMAIGNERIPWNDPKVIREILTEL